LVGAILVHFGAKLVQFGANSVLVGAVLVHFGASMGFMFLHGLILLLI
jgi:hypothetical protein